MVTTLAMVLVAILVAGMVFMVVQAFRGRFLSTVWVCCGGLSAGAELVGALLVGIASAFRGE